MIYDSCATGAASHQSRRPCVTCTVVAAASFVSNKGFVQLEQVRKHAHQLLQLCTQLAPTGNFVAVQVPMDDDDWQCISCRQGSDCACSWCQKYMPQQAETIDMYEEFKKLQQSVLQVAPGTPPPPARTAPPINPTAPSPEPHLPSSGGAGPSRRAHTPPAPAPAPIPAPTPASGGGAAADGLDLSKLAAGRHGVLHTQTSSLVTRQPLCTPEVGLPMSTALFHISFSSQLLY
jgi:hypothetical protein